jgi:hypothetical protein
MKRILPIVPASIFFLIILCSATVLHGQTETTQWGVAVDGVQMSLGTTGSNLQLALRNIGDRDVTLNLGVMLANGKVQLPNRVNLTFTDAQGKTRLFKFADKRGVFGRVDEYVVPLRAGSTYTLQFALDQFWCYETKEFSIPLLAGDNYLTAQFEGAGANGGSSDMAGLRLMNFWIGKVHSNTLILRQ